MNNGDNIIINVPALTEERRRELVKQAKAEGEDAKIGIRNSRKDANSDINNDEEYTEDQEHSELKRIQDLTDKFTDHIDDLIAKKSSEVMTI